MGSSPQVPALPRRESRRIEACIAHVGSEDVVGEALVRHVGAVHLYDSWLMMVVNNG